MTNPRPKEEDLKSLERLSKADLIKRLRFADGVLASLQRNYAKEAKIFWRQARVEKRFEWQRELKQNARAELRTARCYRFAREMLRKS